MIELIISCLNSYVSSENFDAKLMYILEMEGIEQLSRWIVQSEPYDKYGKGANKNLIRSIRLKLFQLLNDLLINQHSILQNQQGEQDFVLKCVSFDKALVKHILALVQQANFNETKDIQLRSQYLLNILFRLNDPNDQKLYHNQTL